LLLIAAQTLAFGFAQVAAIVVVVILVGLEHLLGSPLGPWKWALAIDGAHFLRWLATRR